MTSKELNALFGKFETAKAYTNDLAASLKLRHINRIILTPETYNQLCSEMGVPHLRMWRGLHIDLTEGAQVKDFIGAQQFDIQGQKEKQA